MLRQHGRRNTEALSRDYVRKSVIGNSRKEHVPTLTRSGGTRPGHRLSQRPKLGTIKKTKEYLTLRDKRLHNLGFLALERQGPSQSTSDRAVGSGAVTRSQRAAAAARPEERLPVQPRGGRRQRGAAMATAATPRPSSTTKPRERRPDGTPEMTTTTTTTRTTKETMPTLTESGRATLERKLREEEETENIPFSPHTFLILDDSLVPPSPLRTSITGVGGGLVGGPRRGEGSAAEIVRNERDRYVGTLQFIANMFLGKENRKMRGWTD